jgi:hypothetical protein
MTPAQRILDQASRADLLDSIRALPWDAVTTVEDWLANVTALHPIFTSDLSWLTRADRRWVFAVTEGRIKDALTKFYPREYVEQARLEQSLDPFVKWLGAQPDRRVVQFSWDILAWRPSLGWTGAWYPIRFLADSGRLAGEISRENIEIATSIVEESRAMDSWPQGRWRFIQWKTASQTYLKSLEDPSHLVRAASAEALGGMLLGCWIEGEGCGAPPVTELLEFVQKQEQKRAGVAGPFLQGTNFLDKAFDEWLAEWPAPADFDMRRWFLETLRTSSREADKPHFIGLEFFAHEAFCCDADAIEEMISMGREYAAVLTATEQPKCIEALLPVLTKMSRSSNPRVANAIQEYLKVRSAHAGLDLLEDE